MSDEEFREKLEKYKVELENNFSLISFAGTINTTHLDKDHSTDSISFGHFIYRY